MNEHVESLARRAVACKHWRWMPGMRDQYRRRILAEQGTVSGCGNPANNALGVVAATPASHPAFELQLLRAAAIIPDLTDPATLGCLLALVREAWGAPCGQVSPFLDGVVGWVWYHNLDRVEPRPTGATEAEALVAALEAAP